MENFVAQKIFSGMPIIIFSPRVHFRLNQRRLNSFSHSYSYSFPLHSQIRRNVVFAANKKGKRGFAVSGKGLLESCYHIASKLKILPEPVDLLIKESGIGGGNRGGFLGFGKGSGWGGSDGRGGRGKKIKFGFLGVLVVLGLGFWLMCERLQSDDALLRGFGLVLIGLSVDGWSRGMKDWVLGFCCCAFLVLGFLKKDDFQKWSKRLKSSVAKKLGRRRGRKIF